MGRRMLKGGWMLALIWYPYLQRPKSKRAGKWGLYRPHGVLFQGDFWEILRRIEAQRRQARVSLSNRCDAREDRKGKRSLRKSKGSPRRGQSSINLSSWLWCQVEIHVENWKEACKRSWWLPISTTRWIPWLGGKDGYLGIDSFLSFTYCSLNGCLRHELGIRHLYQENGRWRSLASPYWLGPSKIRSWNYTSWSSLWHCSFDSTW